MKPKKRVLIIPAILSTAILLYCINARVESLWIMRIVALCTCLDWYIYGVNVERLRRIGFMEKAQQDIVDKLKSEDDDERE